MQGRCLWRTADVVAVGFRPAGRGATVDEPLVLGRPAVSTGKATSRRAPALAASAAAVAGAILAMGCGVWFPFPGLVWVDLYLVVAGHILASRSSGPVRPVAENVLFRTWSNGFLSVLRMCAG